jgi:hypothetical protein
MADARAVNFTPADIAPILQVPPGAAGVAQPAQIITPPGYYDQQNPWVNAFGQIFDNMNQQAAQKRSQQQYQQAVQGIGEFWPQLQAMGVSEGQVNSMLKAGMTPEAIIHSAFTDEASRHMKQYEWLREDYTHARGLSEQAFTPDQLDVVDQYRQGKLSLPDAMRQSSLTPTQLKSALSEMSAGQALQGTMTADQIKKVQLKKDELDVADLPKKLREEGQKRQLELKNLQFKVDHDQDREDREKARQDLEEKRFQFEQWKATNKPNTTKGLPPELQQQANSLKGLATPMAMYQQAKRAGLDVRQPTKAPVDQFGLTSGKGESKDAYYRDVIMPALQNKHLNSGSSQQSFTYPNTPVGKAAQKAAQEFGLDPNVFGRQLQQESGFNPAARSPVGAIGPAQLMPATARALGVDPNNPTENVRGGAKYMKQLLDKYGGDYKKALSAYNAGPDPRNWNNRETQNYVQSILGPDLVTPVSKQLSRPQTQQKRKSLDDIL